MSALRREPLTSPHGSVGLLLHDPMSQPLPSRGKAQLAASSEDASPPAGGRLPRLTFHQGSPSAFCRIWPPFSLTDFIKPGVS